MLCACMLPLQYQEGFKAIEGYTHHSNLSLKKNNSNVTPGRHPKM